jgi:hypothetical protein
MLIPGLANRGLTVNSQLVTECGDRNLHQPGACLDALYDPSTRMGDVPIPKFAGSCGIFIGELRTRNLLISCGFGSEIRMTESRRHGCGLLNRHTSAWKTHG